MSDNRVFNEIANWMSFMTLAIKELNPDVAHAFMSASIYGAELHQDKAELLRDIYSKHFGDRPIGTVVSSDVFETIISRQRDQK